MIISLEEDFSSSFISDFMMLCTVWNSAAGRKGGLI